MDEKLREKFVSAIEKAILIAGANDYEQGMQTTRKLLEWANENVKSIQTLDGLRTVLDSCPQMSKREEMIGLFLTNRLPQVIRFGLKIAAKKAVETIPAMKGGRPPAIPPQRVYEVLDYVSTLHRKGCSWEAAIRRTAMRFEISERTIERLWSRRESISDDDVMPEVTFEDAIGYLVSGE